MYKQYRYIHIIYVYIYNILESDIPHQYDLSSCNYPNKTRVNITLGNISYPNQILFNQPIVDGEKKYARL